MNTIDITPIVNAALALIGAGVSVFLIPWLKKQTTEAQRKELTAWVKIGVVPLSSSTSDRAAERRRSSTSSTS